MVLAASQDRREMQGCLHTDLLAPAARQRQKQHVGLVPVSTIDIVPALGQMWVDFEGRQQNVTLWIYGSMPLDVLITCDWR